MLLTLVTAVSLQMSAAVTAAMPATTADSSPSSSWHQVSPPDASSAYDREAEAHLLQMANSERAHIGLPALKLDDGLVRAARAHAAEMASKNKLAHQFSGEPSLTERIGANCVLHLNREGENVAVAPNAEDAHAGLMSSPPHRDNLLSPNFNVAGFGVFRSGHWLYVTQDFGSSTPAYSVKQAQELVSTSVEQLRAQTRMPRLQRVENRYAQTSACAMAQADSLNGSDPPSGSYMLRYTSMQPETLPTNISKIIAHGGLRTYSAGTCYARTQKYPSGAYWVVLVFY
jgi:uncharacterized protein YkwD